MNIYVQEFFLINIKIKFPMEELKFEKKNENVKFHIN